jgi:hypothetical protein
MALVETIVPLLLVVHSNDPAEAERVVEQLCKAFDTDTDVVMQTGVQWSLMPGYELHKRDDLEDDPPLRLQDLGRYPMP